MSLELYTKCMRSTSNGESELKWSFINCLSALCFSSESSWSCDPLVPLSFSTDLHLQRFPAEWLVSLRASWCSGESLVMDPWRGTSWPHAALLITTCCLFFVCFLLPSLVCLCCTIFFPPMPPILQCPFIPNSAHTPHACCFFLSLLSPLSPSLPSSAPNPAAPSLCLSGRPAADAAPEAQAGCVQRHARADCQIQHGLHG